MEALADKDPLFADNYRALIFNGTQDPVKSNVQAWLIRSHYARARRNEQQKVVHFNPHRLEKMEKELFYAA